MICWAFLLSLLISVQEAPGSWLARFQRAQTEIRAGELDAAATSLLSCFELAPENATTAYHLACVYARAEQPEDAILWLERAVEWGWMDGAVLAWDPDLAPLRTDERFDALMARAASNPEAESRDAELVTSLSLLSPHISADGERLLTSGPLRAFLWDVATAELLAVLPVQPVEPLTRARFDLSGEFIVTTDLFQKHQLWDGHSGRFLRQIEPAGRFLDGELMPANGRGIWFDQGALRCSLADGDVETESFGNASEGIATSPDGSRVLALGYKEATLWDGTGRELIARIPMLGSPRHRVGFSPDGGTAYVANAAGVVQWIDARDGSVVRRLDPDAGSALKCVVFADPDTLIIVQIDGRVRWWQADSDAPLREWRIPAPEHTYLDFVDVGVSGTRLVALVSAGSERSLQLWDCESETLLREWAKGSAAGTRFFGTDQLLIPLPDDQLEVVAPSSGRTLWTTSKPSDEVPWLGIEVNWPIVLPDDRTVLVPVSDGTLRAFDLSTGATSWILTGPGDRIHEIDVRRDGSLAAAASMDGSAYVWDLRDRKLVATFSDAYGSGKGGRIAIHPQEDRIATWGEDSVARVWSVASGSILFNLPAGTTHLEWSPDGAFLGSADGRRVRLWSADTGRSVGVAINHPDPVHSLAFSPDVSLLATGAEDPLVRFWSVPGGELQGEVPFGASIPFGGPFQFECSVEYLAWTSRDDLLATTSSWGSVQCIDTAEYRVRWSTGEGGNLAPPLYAIPSERGTRVYVSGMSTTHAKALDADEGRELADISKLGIWSLSGTSDDRLVIGEAGGTVVLDGASFQERYRRVEYGDGEALIATPSLVFTGERRAVRGAYLTIGTDAYALDGLAPVFYDPKRVLASAAGVQLRRPSLPPPPRIVDLKPTGRVVNVSTDTITIIVRAEAEDSVLTFQIERDGEILALEVPGVEIEQADREAVLKWALARPDSGKAVLRIRAVGASGVLSRPALLTLLWD